VKVLLATPFITSEHDIGHFVLSALGKLNASTIPWDYRLTGQKPECRADVSLVFKGESIEPDELDGVKVNYYPDVVTRYPELVSKLAKYDKVYGINKPPDGYEWVEWLPGCYDEDLHKDRGLDRKFDLCYVGTANSTVKVDFIRALHEKVRFPIFGSNWHGFGLMTRPLNLVEYAQMLNGCKIALNVHQDMKHGTNTKIAEIPACGALMLTDRAEGVEDLFGRLADKISFTTPEEALELIGFYLEDPDERRKALEQERKIIAPFTYRNRVAKILEDAI